MADRSFPAYLLNGKKREKGILELSRKGFSFKTENNVLLDSQVDWSTASYDLGKAQDGSFPFKKSGRQMLRLFADDRTLPVFILEGNGAEAAQALDTLISEAVKEAEDDRITRQRNAEEAARREEEWTSRVQQLREQQSKEQELRAQAEAQALDSSTKAEAQARRRRDEKKLLSGKLSEERARMAALKVDLSKTKKRLRTAEQLRQNTENELNRSREEEAGLAGRLSKAEAELQEQTGRNGALVQELQDAKAQLQEKNERNGVLERELEEAKAELGRLGKELASATGQVEELKKSLDRKEKQLAEQSANIEKLNETLREESDRLAKSDKAVEEQKAAAWWFEDALHKEEELNRSACSQIEEAINRVREHVAEIGCLKEELLKEKDLRDEVQKQLQEKMRSLKEAIQKQDEQKKMISQLNAVIDNVHKAVSALIGSGNQDK